MPRLNKLSAPETAALERPTIGTRAQVAREYDTYLSGFVAGDYGRAELADGERRVVVRARLQAAARRRGLALRFRPGPNPALIFRVEVAPAPAVSPEPVPVAVERDLPPVLNESAAPAPQGPYRRQSAAERYHDVLPRWMRDGGAARLGRPGRRRPR